MESTTKVDVLIAGDSWSQGEWSECGIILHKGLQQYLEDDGYHVTCVLL